MTSLQSLTVEYKARVILRYWSRGEALPLTNSPPPAFKPCPPMLSITQLTLLFLLLIPRRSSLCRLPITELQEVFCGSGLGRATKAEDTEAILLLEWGKITCLCKMYHFPCSNCTVPNAQESEKDSKRQHSGGQEKQRRKKKVKKITEHKNYWPQTYHNFREALGDLNLNFHKKSTSRSRRRTGKEWSLRTYEVTGEPYIKSDTNVGDEGKDESRGRLSDKISHRSQTIRYA